MTAALHFETSVLTDTDDLFLTAVMKGLVEITFVCGWTVLSAGREQSITALIVLMIRQVKGWTLFV